MPARLGTAASTAWKPSLAPERLGGFQRKCARGGAPGLDGGCPACRQKRLSLPRTGQAEFSEVPPNVQPVVRSPGQPLDPTTRASMEPRLGHDFSRVRVLFPSAPLRQLWPEHPQIARRAQLELSGKAPPGMGMSPPGSPEEREADQVAAQVTDSGHSPTIHQGPSSGVQRSETGAARPSRIPTEGGMPLPAAARRFFEPRIGHTLGNVRIHTDGPAARSALSLRAAAFTLGDDVYFAAGRFAPGTTAGRRLIAHELTHTIQQQGAPRMIMRQADAPGARPEPGPYDGCPDPAAIKNQRAEAAGMVANAIELLDGKNVKQAGPLLEAHFHLDPAKPESRADLGLIRDQFVRMRGALKSGIRILCRSAARSASASPKPSMPLDEECTTDVAHSTSCAAGDSSSTVTLCESALQWASGPLVKTLIHEFAHVACNGSPPIASGGPAEGEVSYDGTRLPGDETNVLTHAESYAWFAVQAKEPKGGPAPQPGRAPWATALGWVMLGVASALAAFSPLGLLAGSAAVVGGLLGASAGVAAIGALALSGVGPFAAKRPVPRYAQGIRFPAIWDIIENPTVKAQREKDWSDALKDRKERGAWIMWQGSPGDSSSGDRDDTRGRYSLIPWPLGVNEQVTPADFPSEHSMSLCVAHFHLHPPLEPAAETGGFRYPVGASVADTRNAEREDSPGVVRDFETEAREKGSVRDYFYGPLRRGED